MKKKTKIIPIPLLKYSILLLLLIIIVVFIAPTRVYSQKYSLEDCINIALKNNFDIEFTKYQKNSAEASKKTALGAYLPSINFNAGYGRQLNNTISAIDPNSFNAGVQANLLLFNGFAREANYNIANIQSDITDLKIKYLIEQVKNNIYLQYIEIMRLSEVVKAREEDINSGKIELENLRARFNAQVIPINSVLSQEAELGNKEIMLLQSQIDINLNKQNLLIILGLNPSSPVEFSDTNIPKIITQDEINKFREKISELDNLINLAFRNRVDYSTYNLSKESAGFSKKIANSEYYPTVYTSLGYNWTNSQIKDFNLATAQFAINLSVPIFNNFSANYHLQQAELAYQQENTLLLKAEQNVRVEVQTAYFNLEAAEKSIKISEKATIAARQNFNAVKERLDIGSATITDYITANTQYITSQINHISTSYMYLKAKRNLLFSIGEYNTF